MRKETKAKELQVGCHIKINGDKHQVIQVFQTQDGQINILTDKKVVKCNPEEMFTVK